MKFYKYNKDSKNIWLDKGQNDFLTRINNGLKIHDLENILFKGVKKIDSTRIDELIQVDLTDKEIKKLTELHNINPTPMTLKKIKSIGLKILNKAPRLYGATCMGWPTFPLRKDDPNLYSGEYIFPDGNIYTIVKCRSKVEVYPSKGDHCLMMNNKKLPLVSFKINVEQWAERLDNENIQITEITN